MYRAAPLPDFILRLDPARHCGLDLGHVELGAHPLAEDCVSSLGPVGSPGGISSLSDVGATPLARPLQPPQPQLAAKAAGVRQRQSQAHNARTTSLG